MARSVLAKCSCIPLVIAVLSFVAGAPQRPARRSWLRCDSARKLDPRHDNRVRDPR